MIFDPSTLILPSKDLCSFRQGCRVCSVGSYRNIVKGLLGTVLGSFKNGDNNLLDDIAEGTWITAVNWDELVRGGHTCDRIVNPFNPCPHGHGYYVPENILGVYVRNRLRSKYAFIAKDPNGIVS
jgi:hypothetical protein